MIPPRNYCEANLSDALTVLLGRLGERPIYMDEVVNDDLTVAHIHQTTWEELTDRKLVTARMGIGCCRYQLTGSGWLEALKRTGQLDTSQFQERFGRLNTVLETLVDGRMEEAFAPAHMMAAQADIPQEWLYNMLESRIWEHEHRRRGAALDDSKTMVVVPVDFNLPLAPVPASDRDHRKPRLAVGATPMPRHPSWAPATSFLREIKAWIGRYGRVFSGRGRAGGFTG